jgi:putative peptidoglycan lipid II flippase
VTTGSRVFRAAGVMTVGTALSRITGVVRVAAMTYALGVTGTRLADTYNLANTTPNIVYELFLGGIFTSVFVPVLIASRERREGDQSALVSMSLIALGVLSAFTAVAAPLIMRIYTFRIDDPTTRAAQLELASHLLRWFAPQIFFYGVAAIAQALLNVRGRFGPASFAPVVNNLVVAGTFVYYARTIAEHGLDLTVHAKVVLGVGTTAGVVLQAVVLLPLLRSERLRLRFAPRDAAVRTTFRLATFVIGYVVVNQILLWVVLALANSSAGDVTAWNVAYWFFQLPHGLFAVSLNNALLPDLSRAVASSNWSSFRESFSTGVRGVLFFLVPSAIGYALIAAPVTRLILAHGVADASDAAAVADVLRMFALGLPSFSIFQLLTRSFYSLQDTRTPTLLNTVAVAFNIAIDLPIYSVLGVRGLAIGHALSYTLGAVMLAIVLARRIPGGLGLRALQRPIARTALAGGVMGAVVFVVSQALPGGDIAVVSGSILSGVVVYLGGMRLLGETPVLSSYPRFRRSDDPPG